MAKKQTNILLNIETLELLGKNKRERGCSFSWQIEKALRKEWGLL